MGNYYIYNNFTCNTLTILGKYKIINHFNLILYNLKLKNL